MRALLESYFPCFDLRFETYNVEHVGKVILNLICAVATLWSSCIGLL